MSAAFFAGSCRSGIVFRIVRPFLAIGCAAGLRSLIGVIVVIVAMTFAPAMSTPMPAAMPAAMPATVAAKPTEETTPMSAAEAAKPTQETTPMAAGAATMPAAPPEIKIRDDAAADQQNQQPVVSNPLH